MTKIAARYPYEFVLDEVAICYDQQKRAYTVRWHKIVRNLARVPLECVYARIDVCVLPNARELANRYYRILPIDLEAIKFVARHSDGSKLRHEIVRQYDSNIELDIFFRDASTGRQFPARQGESREIFYEIEVTDHQWGPYLERHVRVPCETVRVELQFPKDLMKLCGEEHSAAGHRNFFQTPIVHDDTSGQDRFVWCAERPTPGTRYRFTWSFGDQREMEVRDEIERLLTAKLAPVSEGQSHSPDYRSIVWDGIAYTLTTIQAAAVEALWEAYTRGAPEVSQEWLLESIGSDAKRLRDLFRRHPAWRQVIVQGRRRGTYRLAPLRMQSGRMRPEH